jgi:uncharacterized protein YegP (UPF0339 family)
MTCRIRRSGAHYYVRVVASNGATLAHSENYTTKANAQNCANILAGGGRVIDET